MPLPLRTSLIALALAGGFVPASAATLTFENVQFPGTGVPLVVTGSDGTVFTFSAGSSSQFQSFQSGGQGSFPANTFFLAAGLGNSSPITIGFSTALSSFTIPVSSDRTGDSPYTSTVQLRNGQQVVDTQSKSGNTMNSALVFSSVGIFTSATVSTFVSNAPFGYTQNIGPITYTSAIAVPGPVAGAGIPAVLALGGLLAFRRRRAKGEVA